MVDEGALLSGIVEADEAYVGGKPRKPNKREDDRRGPRGRGTDKLPIIGAVERGGRVVAKPSLKVDVAALTSFLNETVDKASLLMTDAWVGYRQMRRHMRHVTVDHSKHYVRRAGPYEHHRGFLGSTQAGLVRYAPPLYGRTLNRLRR